MERSEAFDDGDIGLAATLTHRLQSVATTGSLEFVQQRGHETSPGGSEWMPKGDCSTVDIDLRHVGVEFLLPTLPR